MNKLLVSEFTKSRAHRTTDNALVEGKNGAVVRKHIGHEPIAAEHATELQRFSIFVSWAIVLGMRTAKLLPHF